jgi:hypothetical protein
LDHTTRIKTDITAMERKYAMLRHQWDATQRRKDPVAEKVTRKREILALVCSWKTFIRIERTEINVTSTVHSQLVRSRLASSEMFIVGRVQN